MPSLTKFILVSLPLRIFDSTDQEDVLASLGAKIPADSGTALPFPIPEFKIGTLDALVQQADDLAKLDGGCAGVVARVADSLKGILDGDEDKAEQQKRSTTVMHPHRPSNTTPAINRVDRAHGPVPTFLQLEQGQVSCRPPSR